MIYNNEIYSNIIQEYINYFRDNNQRFEVILCPADMTIWLPQEAYLSNGYLYIAIDFGAEETYTADFTKIEGNIFTCCCVYQGIDGWEEYIVEVPVMNIIGITRPKEIPMFKVKDNNYDFDIKTQEHKKYFKYLSGEKLWNL